MEIASALVLLGGLYVISNQNKNGTTSDNSKVKRENFANNDMKRLNKREFLPNADPLVQNYPILITKELVNTTSH